MTHIYSLPLPPSANSYYRSLGRGRVVISAAGREYRKTVWALAMQTGQPAYTCRIVVTVAVTFARTGRMDLDNRLKPLLDALQHARAYDDDSQIDDLRIYRCGAPRPPGDVLVTIKTLEPLPPRWQADHVS